MSIQEGFVVERSVVQPINATRAFSLVRFNRLHPTWVMLGVLACAVATMVVKLSNHGFDPVKVADIDGVFVLRLAQSLPSLHAEVDVPAYRAQRILLSMLAAPFGPLVPWALIGINLAAIAAGTYAVARIGQRTNTSTVLGATFGLWIGTLYALHVNLTEILTYALVAWSILWWEEGRVLWTAALCGLAVLAKETAVLYVVAFLLGSHGLSWNQRSRFALIGFMPMVVWQTVLLVVLGMDGLRAGMGSAGAGMLPLVGYLQAERSLVMQLLLVAAPSMLATVWGAWRLLRGPRDAVAWALLLNGLFVLSLPSASTAYLVHSSRIGLAMVLALAWAMAWTGRRRWVVLLIGCMVLPSLLFRVDLYY